MKILLYGLAFFLAFPALAQIPEKSPDEREGAYSQKPLCAKILNGSDIALIGTLLTAPQTIESGDKVRHRKNFKLQPGEKADFCATGPFYQGQRLELVLRTAFPVFTCRTKIDREIVLSATRGADGRMTYGANCR
jgi:hypothetical protein